MKKQFFKSAAILLTVIIIISFSALNIFASEPEATLTIFHINDVHGRTWAEPYISQMAKELKENGGNVLIFDSGDRLHGQVAANLSEGESMITVMNAVGYSAMVPGNHDFNFGFERLKELSESAEFPLLAANVKNSDGANVFEQFKIFEFDGIKIGVFGIITPETLTKTDSRNTAGLTFETPAATAVAMVSALQSENCDIIIAIAHLGEDEASEFKNTSDAVAAIDGIDLIFDGHSHTLLENGRTVGNTLIAQAGNHSQSIGVAEITISGGIISKSAKIIDLSGGEFIPDEKIVAVIEAEEAKIDAVTSVIVGHTPVLLQGEREFVRKQETNLANIITDSLIHATGAEIALYNGGGIRESIEAGAITMGQILTVLPFSNLVVTLELLGADILKAVEHGVSEYPELTGAFIQVAGLKFDFEPTAEPGKRVTEVKLSNGQLLEPNKIYTVSTIEYLALGGDGYDMLAHGQNLVYYGGDAEAFAAYLSTNPLISSESEGRGSVFGENLKINTSVSETSRASDLLAPKTGDSNNVILWFYAVSVVILGLRVLPVIKKRKV